jgi:hypothetical protein
VLLEVEEPVSARPRTLSLAQPMYAHGDVGLAVAELDVVELTEGLEVEVEITELELDKDDWLVVVGCAELDVEIVVWLLEIWLELDELDKLLDVVCTGLELDD